MLLRETELISVLQIGEDDAAIKHNTLLKQLCRFNAGEY